MQNFNKVWLPALWPTPISCTKNSFCGTLMLTFYNGLNASWTAKTAKIIPKNFCSKFILFGELIINFFAVPPNIP